MFKCADPRLLIKRFLTSEVTLPSTSFNLVAVTDSPPMNNSYYIVLLTCSHRVAM